MKGRLCVRLAMVRNEMEDVRGKEGMGDSEEEFNAVMSHMFWLFRFQSTNFTN